MVGAIQFSIKGIEEFKDFANTLPEAYRKFAMDGVLKNSAKEAAKLLEPFVPVDTSESANKSRSRRKRKSKKKTGETSSVDDTKPLRQKLVVKKLNKRQMRKHHPEADPNDSIYHVRFNKLGFYGYFLEYGTSKMPAKPFFWNALNAVTPIVMGNLKESMKKTLKALARKIRRDNQRSGA